MNDRHRQILDVARDVLRLEASVRAGEAAMEGHAQEMERCQLRRAEDTEREPMVRAMVLEEAKDGRIHMGAVRELAQLERSVNHWRLEIERREVVARADRELLETRRCELAEALERFAAAADFKQDGGR